MAACGGGDGEAGESEATPIPIPQDPAADIRRIVAGLGDDTSSKPEIAAPEGHRRPSSRSATSCAAKGPGEAGRLADDAVWRRLVVDRRGVRRVLGRARAVHVRARAGDVIPGWDEGLVGMREGGRRCS